MNGNGGKIVAEVLRQEGVKKVFCVPGESFLHVLDALYDYPDIELITTRHEGGASFMSEGYAKASGEVGVCMATRGVGSTNLSIGIHTAFQDSTPMVALIGQVDRPFKHKEAFQEIDLEAYFGHICKWTVEIDDVERIPELLHRAFHVARSGRPGPVLVSLPEDMLSDLTEININTPMKLKPSKPDGDSIKKALTEVSKAKRPIIIAGGGVVRSKASDLLVKLAEELQIPVVTSFRRFDAFPNSHKNYIGSLGLSTPQYLLDYIKQADVAIALGTRFSQITSQDYTLLNGNTQLIHVDISQEELGKIYTPSLAIASDVKEFIQSLLTQHTNTVPVKREELINELHEKYLAYSTPIKEDSDAFVDMEGMIFDFMCNVPKNSIITTDAGNFFSWISRFYRFDYETTYIGPTNGAMGYGLPSAIGAKLAHPDRTVISFSGDGGYMMTMQEFETAVRYNIPVIAVVVNNNMYGTIRMHQERTFPNRVIGTELSNPSFAEIANLFGGYGEKVEKNAEFIPALKRALAASRPALIELKTNPAILSAIKKRNRIQQFKGY